jgi:hypothetical protein
MLELSIGMTAPKFVIAAAVMLAVAPCSPISAQDKAALPMAPERIVTPIPAGWAEVYHAKDARQEVREFVPGGEKVDNWSAMVTTKIFDGLARGAKEYNTHTMDRFASLCTEAVKIVGETEDRFGYPSSLAFIECVTSPATREKNKYVRKVEFLVQIAIKGSEALYVAESAWHTDDISAPRPTQDPDLLNRVTSRLDNVFVCDDRIDEKKCQTQRAKAK